jgi:hypothetical protein
MQVQWLHLDTSIFNAKCSTMVLWPSVIIVEHTATTTGQFLIFNVCWMHECTRWFNY